MVISTEHKCIFIHVNKTGGRSISTSLFQRIKPHLTVGELFELEHNIEIHSNERLQNAQYDDENILVKNNWKNYFKFCFVRNPWDRKLSDYFYNIKRGRTTHYIKINHKNTDLWNSPGLEWIEYKDGSIDPSIFIGRFENLQEDFNIVCDNINVPRRILPVINKTEHLPYWKYYTEETKALVEEKYKKDIDYFSYEFGK
jgi:hypothetical protein